MNSDPNRHVILGHVVGVFGIKGWLKVHSDTEPAGNILNFSPWYLGKNDDWRSLKVREGQAHTKGQLIVHLEGCDDRDQAAALIGSQIAVLRSQLPAPAAGEYYWSDLIGLSVFTLQGQYIGKVDSLMPTGANDVLVVQGEQAQILIPYVKDHYIQAVDLTAGRIDVDWDLSPDDDLEGIS